MKNGTNNANVFFRLRELFGEGERGRSMYDSRLSGSGDAGAGARREEGSSREMEPSVSPVSTGNSEAGVFTDAGNSRTSFSSEKKIFPQNRSSGNRESERKESSSPARKSFSFSGGGSGRRDREKKFPWVEMLVIYVCILLAGALLPGIIGEQRRNSGNETVQTTAEQAGQSEPVRQSLPQQTQQNTNAPEFERGPEGGPSDTVYASQVTQLQDNALPQTEPVSTSPLIDVDSVTISADASWMRQNESLQMSASIVPENATYPALTWRSSDENVARISPSGLVTSVGGGTTIISATTSNGLVVEYPIEVSYIERRMVLDVTRQTVENNSVGEEWSSTYKVNDEEITGRTELILVLGDTITVSSTVIENDEDPDIGTAEGEYTVDEDGLENGFVMQQEVVVEENEGEFAGNTASFLVTYNFSNP